MPENKMGYMPIPKLIISMSLPTIFSMLIQALYNVVDSIFVARISDTNNDGLTAISLAFPLQLIVIAVFVGLGIGMNALISRKLGERKPEEAALIAENGVMMAAVLSVIVAVLGYFFARPFFELFTDKQAVVEYGVEYTQIIMLYAFGRILGRAATSILQGTGEMIIPMISLILGAVLNIILDPILIFGYFGFAAMGVRGAAIATVVAQIISMIFAWAYIFAGKSAIHIDVKKFRPKARIIRQILLIALPVSIVQGLGSVMLIGLNLILRTFGNVAIDVMGSYYRLQSMVFMPVFGLSTGTMPIVGFNYGARNRERVVQAIRFSTILAVSFMTICLVVFQAFPEPLLRLYNPSEDMIVIGLVAYRRISWMFPFFGASVILNIVFQAFSKAHFSLVTSMVRQIILLLPIAYLFSLSGNVDNVWFAFVIAEGVGLLVTITLFRLVFKQKEKHFEKN